MRVLVVDDHTVMRKGLCNLLAQEPDIDIVGEAGDGKLAIEMARELRPSVVLMDLNLPGVNGIDATRIIRAEVPRVRVIGLSMEAHCAQAEPMLAAGAAGYVCKSEAPDVLLAAIRGSTA